MYADTHIASTAIYKEAFTPPSLRDVNVEFLAALWAQELLFGIEGTNIRVGFIKLAVSDDGPAAFEIANLQGTARASAASGAVIACHADKLFIFHDAGWYNPAHQTAYPMRVFGDTQT